MMRFHFHLLVSVLCCAVFSSPALAAPLRVELEPAPTRWVSPDGQPKLMHNVLRNTEPLLIEAPLKPLDMAYDQASRNGRVAVVVHNSIYDSVYQSVLEYTWDLHAAGYSTTIYRYVSGSAESFRSYLAGLYNEPEGLKGAVLIGNIPYIIYEMMQDWDGPGGAAPEYDDFPCDIFYMDLNGVWSDTLTNGSVRPANGKYDTRSGDLNLEIWVARIKADNLSSLGTEASLVNSYLARAHAYRTLASVTAKKALVYDDDDWSNMASDDAGYLSYIFGSANVTSISAAESTTAADFKANRLPQSTRWYLLRSHGYAGGHGFYRSNKTVFDYVYASDYRSLDPPGAFYSLFVCSGCDYTASNNLGATVAFNPQSAALMSIGSTKTGGMWQDYFFYTPIWQGECIGESFRQWFNAVQWDPVAPQWWYGMVMLGDATLKPDYTTIPTYYTLTVSVNSASSGSVTPSVGTHTYPAGQVVPVKAVPASGYKFDHWIGAVADPYSDTTTLTLTSDQTLTAVFVSKSVSEAKLLYDDTSITLSGKVITYADSGYFYIEDDDRNCGIRVEKTSHGLAQNARVNVTGTMKTGASGERHISATTISTAGSGSIKPVGLACKALGGDSYHYQPGPPKRGQRGVKDGTGLNNIGLLVRITGRFIWVSSSEFRIDDGSGASIRCLVPAGTAINQSWKYVSVTGISSCYASGTDLLPVLQIRRQSDITVVQ